jgi:hypothetical protein
MWNIGNGMLVVNKHKYILIGIEEENVASYEIQEIWKKIELWSKYLSWSDEESK